MTRRVITIVKMNILSITIIPGWEGTYPTRTKHSNIIEINILTANYILSGSPIGVK